MPLPRDGREDALLPLSVTSHAADRGFTYSQGVNLAHGARAQVSEEESR